jgi:hypothetical protein
MAAAATTADNSIAEMSCNTILNCTLRRDIVIPPLSELYRFPRYSQL